MSDTIVGALQEYLDQCPLLGGRRLNVDYITRRPLTYMISPSPVFSVKHSIFLHNLLKLNIPFYVLHIKRQHVILIIFEYANTFKINILCCEYFSIC